MRKLGHDLDVAAVFLEAVANSLLRDAVSEREEEKVVEEKDEMSKNKKRRSITLKTPLKNK